MSDVDFAEMVDWLNDDPNTTCITLYIEGFKDGSAFPGSGPALHQTDYRLEIRRIRSRCIRCGLPHWFTGRRRESLWSGFQQAGVVQATDLDNLFDLSLALSLQPPMQGDNLVIITNGGGVGVLATDAAETFGYALKFAPPDVQEELKKHMPDFGSAKNPVDLTGMAGYEWYGDSVRFCLRSPLDGWSCHFILRNGDDRTVGNSRID